MLVFFNSTFTFERFLGEWGIPLNRTSEVLNLLTKAPPSSVQTFLHTLSFLIMGIHILNVRKENLNKI